MVVLNYGLFLCRFVFVHAFSTFLLVDALLMSILSHLTFCKSRCWLNLSTANDEYGLPDDRVYHV